MKRIKDEMDLLTRMMKAIAAQAGPDCEVVLHDYEDDYDHTIVAIENGHVTGRKVGDCGTNLGLEVLRGTVSNGDKYNYMTQTRDGKMLKSSSIYIYDDDGQAIGALCMNWDITEYINAGKALQHITDVSPDDAADSEVKEVISSNVNDILDAMIYDSLNYVGKPVDKMSKEDKMKGLRYLDEKGAFLIKKSGEKVMEFYKISKYTLYNYLDQSQART